MLVLLTCGKDYKYTVLQNHCLYFPHQVTACMVVDLSSTPNFNLMSCTANVISCRVSDDIYVTDAALQIGSRNHRHQPINNFITGHI